MGFHLWKMASPGIKYKKNGVGNPSFLGEACYQGSLNGTHIGGIKIDAKVAGKFGGFPLVHEVWIGVI